MNLNGAQFQPALPGLEKVEGGAPASPPEHKFADEAGKKWSGPIPGQMVMGVHRLGGDAIGHISRGAHYDPFYEVDHTGMVQELGDSGRHGSQRWVSPADIEAKQNVQKTVHYYRTYGGAKADNDHIQQHWASQPLQHIPSDHPVHTGQDYRETLWGNDSEGVLKGEVHPEHAEGRARVNQIRDSLQRGHEIQKAAWLLKRRGRLYAMDGHHRIVASREEGKPTYPARVWDLDAEEKQRW